jgi:fatty acid desaturase
MNYHLEHHMYPAIPYRNLPQLHALIGNDLPAPHPNIVAAYADIFRTWKAQKKDPSVFLAPKAK